MADNPTNRDVESLEVTRKEACEALDRQIEAINDIERKAVHAFRLNLLLLGAVLTIASLLADSSTTPKISTVENGLVLAGLGMSGVSIVASILAHTGSRCQTGIGADDVRTVLRRGMPEEEWLTALLYSYTVWMKRNETASRRSGLVLYASQFFLFLAISYYVAGIVYASSGSQFPTGILVLGYGLGATVLLLVSSVLTEAVPRHAIDR